MADYEHLGGLGEVEYYLKSEYPSPCIQCHGLPVDKEICAIHCPHLMKWQVMCGALPPKKERGDIKKMGSNGQRLCQECGGKLLYEDGVIYCAECWAIHMRLRDKETSEQVKYLLNKDWELSQIERMLDMDRGYLMTLAHKMGFSFSQKITQGEKIAVVDYALLRGSKAASEKFGYHPETINRYSRELGFGIKERFKVLKQEAKRMYGEGVSVLEVSHKLGVNRRTARIWKGKD